MLSELNILLLHQLQHNNEMSIDEDFDVKKYLQKVRKSKGYSQDRLCNEAGFSRGTASKIEAGKVDPQLTTLARIAETIDVPLKKIIDFD